MHDILLKLDETNKIFYFIVFGNGTEILKYNSYKNLIFYNFGNVDFLKMSEIYSIADLTLLPSRQETFSQVVSESICFNVPVIVFDETAPKEQISHKQNGYIAKSFNVNDFLKGFQYFYNKRKYLKDKNLTKLKRYKLDKLLNIYDQCLSK